MKKLSTYTLILISFISIILIGAIFLAMPFTQNDGISISFFDALFLSTSAVSVTGLVVADVSSVFNIYGKIVILILIQLGGLGILTFSSIVVLLISRKISYYAKKSVKEDLNSDKDIDIYSYIKGVASVVFGIEIIGAIFLYINFSKEFNNKEAIFYSIFHSISAFCNAGFSLFSNNLENYDLNVSINMIIAFLIIFGGLGFAAIIDIFEYVAGKTRRLTINTKFSISISFSLIIIGMIFFFALEYFNLDKLGYNFFEKTLISFFHSVSTRTAGFNTIPLANLEYGTILVMCILMFIGASPGSTGGGIKTNTVGIIFLGVRATINNKENIEFSKRTISHKIYQKAIALLAIALAYLFFSLLLMSIFDSDKGFLEILFEIVSALGTVGLSTGITEKLSIFSKTILIITMFLGRVGPLTVAFALSKERDGKGKYKYPEENILIG